MARKKVTLAWIANDATRRATLKKRRKGLLKKVEELATLCDVEACAIVYSPHETQPEVWPSPGRVARVLARFRAMPEMEQCKKMMDQEGFLRQRAQKLQEQLRRMDRDNRELEADVLLNEGLGARRSLHGLGLDEAVGLGWAVEMRLKAVQERIGVMRAQAVVVHEEKTAMEAAMEALQRQNWLVEAGMMSPSEPPMVFGGGGGGGGGAEEFMLPTPFVDGGGEMPWSIDHFFPFN